MACAIRKAVTCKNNNGISSPPMFLFLVDIFIEFGKLQTSNEKAFMIVCDLSFKSLFNASIIKVVCIAYLRESAIVETRPFGVFAIKG